MASISLPYYVDAATLPAGLPTLDEIESSQDVLVEQTGRKVVGVGQYYIVKYGRAVELMEGEIMLFLGQVTAVPVPRIYALCKDPSNKKAYIVMERIAGKNLDIAWPSLSQTQKDFIATRLRANFSELRKLPSPGGYCSVGKRPLLDNVFWTRDTVDTISGPFSTEAELNDAMIEKYIFNNLPQKKANFYRRAFPSVLRGHPPVFTHGDFQRKNVMVREVPRSGESEQEECEYEPVIIDWESAGWYLSYWEYSRALFACGGWRDDWSVWVDKILDPFLQEWAWVNMLLTELWF
ncbi:hypothetical protein W97_02425 [Coniosporium apollinis CBS 100218]|uniref:Aminoglycoside phosphotransferase domain-containing protein n=1 Tax=Coniosporium apollinis (strain CBS 100218) TaxID=1168221 RepID=R7YMW2_CONA1|nr:uncharacterized protein W97_02425 [Coniosporium apollinis CBS 100218]EON63198.1 hypothetical protein W97_02425 [Coniosporium apollinis CBS 100218]